MKPIKLQLKKIINQTPKEISDQIADTENWSDFNGYGFLPGIEKAEYEKRTDNMIGSRIRVTNSDGSNHIEEILEWDEENKILIRLYQFSKPLNHLATHFTEEWTFKKSAENKTFVTRKFELFPKSFLTKPFLFLISIFFKKAIARHLEEVKSKKW